LQFRVVCISGQYIYSPIHTPCIVTHTNRDSIILVKFLSVPRSFSVFVIFIAADPCVVCVYAEINSEKFCLPGYNTMDSVECHLMFRSNMCVSSGSKNKPSNKPGESTLQTARQNEFMPCHAWCRTSNLYSCRGTRGAGPAN
jgi:hypothetical protein